MNTKALYYYEQSLKTTGKAKDIKGTAYTLNNIGNIYAEQEEYQKAIVYFHRSLSILTELEDEHGIASTLNNIGNIYNENKEYEKALDYQLRGLRINEGLNDKQGIAISYNNLGTNYGDLKDYSKALKYQYMSLEIMKEIGDKEGSAYTLNIIGNLMALKKDFKVSIASCSTALKIASEIREIFEQKEACQCLYEAYKSMGNGSKALEYHEQMLVLNDSLQSEETAKKAPTDGICQTGHGRTACYRLKKTFRLKWPIKSKSVEKTRTETWPLGQGFSFWSSQADFSADGAMSKSQRPLSRRKKTVRTTCCSTSCRLKSRRNSRKKAVPMPVILNWSPYCSPISRALPGPPKS